MKNRNYCYRLLSLAAVWFVASTGTVDAAADPAVACRVGKVKAASRYSACRFKADAKAANTGGAADYRRCDTRLSAAFTKLEARAGAGVCPSEGDVEDVRAFLGSCNTAVSDAQGGATLPDDAAACAEDLAACNGSLGTCTGSLDTCNGSLGTCTGDLGTCNGSLTACTGNLGTCNGNLGTCGDSLGMCELDLDAAEACGNAELDAGEECDLGTAIASDCNTLTGGALPFGDLTCGAGCAYDTSDCNDCLGENVGGHCWIEGQLGESCDAACGGLGQVYDSATETFGGASADNCQAILDAFGITGSLSSFNLGGSSLNFGCARAPDPSMGFLAFDTSGTDSSSSGGNITRFCVCQ